MIQTSPQNSRFNTISLASIGVWLGLQLVMLSLSAMRVPLWARPPHPIESAAAAHMVAVQMIASALLFGWLMRNVLTSIVVTLSSAPMLQLAGMLAEVPPGRLAIAWVGVLLWLGAAVCFAQCLRSPRAQLIGLALATTLSLGVPIVRYLAQDFSYRPPTAYRAWVWIDPVGNTIAQLQAGPRDVWKLLPGVLIFLVGLSIAMRWRNGVQSTSYPQR